MSTRIADVAGVYVTEFARNGAPHLQVEACGAKGYAVLDLADATKLRDALAQWVEVRQKACRHPRELLQTETRETTYRLTCGLCGAVRGGGVLDRDGGGA